jgi:hypothetical protein
LLSPPFAPAEAASSVSVVVDQLELVVAAEGWGVGLLGEGAGAGAEVGAGAAAGSGAAAGAD